MKKSGNSIELINILGNNDYWKIITIELNLCELVKRQDISGIRIIWSRIIKTRLLLPSAAAMNFDNRGWHSNNWCWTTISKQIVLNKRVRITENTLEYSSNNRGLITSAYITNDKQKQIPIDEVRINEVLRYMK